jgi:TonB family protein
MLAPLQPERGISRTAMVVTVCVHLLAIGILTYKPEPKLLQPSTTLRGDGGSVTHLTFTSAGSSVIDSPIAKLKEDEHALFARKQKKQERAKPEPKPAVVADKELKPGMPGFILGSLANGIPSDHDIRVALPVISPDPPIVRHKLPDWLRGDVVVEVTIDENGSVVKTKVLQTVGYGIDQICVATLLQWRFTPAKIDGVSVASRQDVYFHFPS